ncbi:hypothetical protein [Curvibacter delicatus]|jgi:hypothetical protein|uniref:hypothetical protein n=1 Tax=Curvibacter delicatus TaxID=80879 RepID=UPI000B0885F7|nr:hypothetical protein [Curvibacter delicatus]
MQKLRDLRGNLAETRQISVIPNFRKPELEAIAAEFWRFSAGFPRTVLHRLTAF